MNSFFTVSEVVQGVKTLLEDSFQDIHIEGEVTNLSKSSAGHFYFSLSDGKSLINCCLFRMDALNNPVVFKIKNGAKVIVRGGISVYAKRGSFQLIARKMAIKGKGDLLLQFKLLKEKLEKEGLFSATQKKQLPRFVKKIAVITALRGAALQDFLKILKRRSFFYNIVIIPTLVQGENAPKELRKSFKLAEAIQDVELILLTRGGGSLEDLWAFNDEGLARDIFQSKKIVMSAVGHEVDTSLSDLVADIRAETPSAAAEILTTHSYELKNKLSINLYKFNKFLMAMNAQVQERLNRCSPQNMLHLLKALLESTKSRILKVEFHKNINRYLPINEKTQLLDDLLVSSKESIQSLLGMKETRVNHIYEKLELLNPHNVMERGYSYLQTADGKKVIKRAKDFDKIDSCDGFKINFFDNEVTIKEFSK